MATKHKWIWGNIIGAAVFFLVVFLAAGIALNVITRHGKTVSAPDLTNMTVPEAEKAAHEAGVTVKVVDSVFVRRLGGGVVYRQMPKPGATVKKGRSLFLTINSIVPRKVVMPNLYGYSVTEARAELQNRGLNLGRLNYVRDIATNNVLSWTSEGKELSAGDLVVSGSTIDLTVGVNAEDNSTAVPRLTGMKYVNATDVLHDHFLNVGKVSFDKEIKSYADSMNAVVYKQGTAPGSRQNLGANVTIALTLDTSKLPQ
ncbi:MAG: PASTA domain-containing protein [Bacteroidales bacterium]|nr:PASTA domain-containing protein [Bacteroidales bacterium]